MFLEPADVGVAAQEPEQFVDDRFEVDLLGGEQRKALAKRKAGLRAEDGARAGAGAVGLGTTLLEDEAQEVVVLFHLIRRIYRAAARERAALIEIVRRH